jgi:hypothetical protein
MNRFLAFKQLALKLDFQQFSFHACPQEPGGSKKAQAMTLKARLGPSGAMSLKIFEDKASEFIEFAAKSRKHV